MRQIVRRQGKLMLLSLKLASAEQIQRTVACLLAAVEQAPVGVTFSPQSRRHGGEGTLSGSTRDHRASARPHAIWAGTAAAAALPAPSFTRQSLPGSPLLCHCCNEPVAIGARKARSEKRFCSDLSRCWAESREGITRPSPLGPEAPRCSHTAPAGLRWAWGAELLQRGSRPSGDLGKSREKTAR